MEVPLVLGAPSPGRLRYGVPLWYRGVLALCAAAVTVAIAASEGPPGIVAWLILGLAILGTLYEENWTLDAERGELVHRYGLVVAARTIVIPLGRLESFRITAYVRGTVPGSPDEAAENAAALRSDAAGGGGPDDPRRRKREPHKRAFLQLRAVESSGEEYLVNAMRAGRAGPLRDAGRRLAALAGKPLVEG